MSVGQSTDFRIEPIIGALRVVGGTRLEDAGAGAATLHAPPQAARGRENERLFVLLGLSGLASPRLYRELHEVLAASYWSTAGSITAALRRAAAAANRHLFQVNVDCELAERCYGALTCAVLHGDDLFMVQAGAARACVLHREYLECFRCDKEPTHLGTGLPADVRLYHVFAAEGDTMLLASDALVREGGDEGLSRALARAEVKEVLAELEQLGANVDFSALVVRWTGAQESVAVGETRQPCSRPEGEVAEPRAGSVRRVRQVPGTKPVGKGKPSLGERMKGLARYLARGSTYVGRGLTAVGARLIEVVGAVFWQVIPGSERRVRARPPRRQVPDENRARMVAIAVGIPVVVAIIVALAYLRFGAEARFQSFVEQVEEEIALAQAAGGISEEARPHWEAALEHASTAAALRPDDPTVAALQAEAQAALDRLDRIVRLTPIRLWAFGSGAVGRQLVVHGQLVFVLDPAGGWATRLTLNPAGDGVVEQGAVPILVRKGQRVGDGEVGDLVDLTWVDRGGERQTSGLLILEENGALVTYDPAWADEEGVAQLTRSFLGTPPAGTPRAVGSYEGRFYVLDTVADGSGQIWRYHVRDGDYPGKPDRYFVNPSPRPLTDALDMAIDGNIYVLYADAAISKFLGGEIQPFEVRGVPGGLEGAVAFAVDADSSSGVVYAADRGKRRVVVLGPDGAFQEQFYAEEAFDELEALTVDEGAGRLYVLSGGRLYVASLR